MQYSIQWPPLAGLVNRSKPLAIIIKMYELKRNKALRVSTTIMHCTSATKTKETTSEPILSEHQSPDTNARMQT